ncbi:MAG TPA: nucleoside hydrolase [Anaerolineales bacterium]|nr:nucleoside hydrolase [Anaerolineales bacterium]HNO31286.1 nucleoside hydrolase [Anaerolineales bacterium]
MSPKRIIIDTDPGVDDALTFLLALASPEIQLEALTTVQGNVSIEKATRNALSVLELAHASHIPVAQGCSHPLIKEPHKSGEVVHGSSGIGRSNLAAPKSVPLTSHAVDYLIERALAEPGELSIFPIGPLTNIALAIRKEPRFAKAVKELVIMGGAIRSGGNVTPLAEFNIHEDPHAAHVVFNSGIPITLIPLDVTYKCLLTAEDVEHLNRNESPIAKFVRDATADYMAFYKQYEGFDGCALHDPLTLATVIAPELLTLEEHYVDVDISGGVSTGKTYADFMKVSKRSANMKVALDVKGREFVELFLERISTATFTLRGYSQS